MSIDHTDVLIAGAGLGGARVAEGLRAAGFDGRIVVAGAEQHGPYERPALSKRVLLGECPVSAIGLRPDAYWREHAIELRTGETVDSIDVGACRATAGGHRLRWGRLVLATASAPVASPSSRDSRTSTTCVPPTMPRTCGRAAPRRTAGGDRCRLRRLRSGVGRDQAGSQRQRDRPRPVPFLTNLGPAIGHLMGQNARDAGVDSARHIDRARASEAAAWLRWSYRTVAYRLRRRAGSHRIPAQQPDRRRPLALAADRGSSPMRAAHVCGRGIRLR